MALPSPTPVGPGPSFRLSAGPSVPAQAVLGPGSPHGHAAPLVLHPEQIFFCLFLLARAPVQIFNKHDIATKWY